MRVWGKLSHTYPPPRSIWCISLASLVYPMFIPIITWNTLANPPYSLFVFTANKRDIPEIPGGWCRTSGAPGADPAAPGTRSACHDVRTPALNPQLPIPKTGCLAHRCHSVNVDWILVALMDGYDLWNILRLSQPMLWVRVMEFTRVEAANNSTVQSKAVLEQLGVSRMDILLSLLWIPGGRNNDDIKQES